MTEVKIEGADKNIKIEVRVANKFQKYQNMEGCKQYHVSRNGSFYIFICLYVNAEEVEHFSTSYVDYDDIIEELHKVGFVEGFYSSDVAQKEKDYQKAKQEYEYTLFNTIGRKEDETTGCM